MPSMTTTVQTSYSRDDHMSLLGAFRGSSTYWDELSDAEKQGSIVRGISRPVAGKTAWNVAGELQRKWNNDTHLIAQDKLNCHKSKIHKSGESKVPWTYELWMVGQTEDRAHPTIVVTCSELKVAGRVINQLKRSKIKETGFHFLAHEGHISTNAGDVSLDSGTGGNNLCGASVLVGSPPITSSSKLRKATIGGVIILDQTYYGMTVAHTFFNEVNSAEADTPGNSGSGSASDNDDDLDSGLDECTDSDDDSEGAVRNMEPEYPTASVVYAALTRKPFSEPDEESHSEIQSSDFLGNVCLVGSLPNTESTYIPTFINGVSETSQWLYRTLDWALIRIDDSRFWKCNRVPLPDGGCLFPSRVAPEDPSGVVLVAAGDTGLCETTVSGTRCGTFLPDANCVQDAWSFDLESGIAPVPIHVALRLTLSF